MDPFGGFPQFRVEIRPSEQGQPPVLIIHVPEIQDLGNKIINDLGQVFENAQSGSTGEEMPAVNEISKEPLDRPEQAENPKVLERLAKQFIPERLLHLILAKFQFQRPVIHPHQQKQTTAEEKQDKSRTAQTAAVAKGESKLQAEIPEEIDPTSQIPQDLFEKAAKEIPEKHIQPIDRQMDPQKAKWEAKHVHPMKGESSEGLQTVYDLKEITFMMKGHLPKQELGDHWDGKLHPTGIIPVTQIVLPRVPTEVKERPFPIEGEKSVEKKDNVRSKGNEGAPISAVEFDKEARKPQVPRKDVNYNPEKPESASKEPVPKQNERVEYRFPALPEMRNPDGTIASAANRSRQAKLLNTDGHYLGDLVLMMLCGILCGSRTPSEIFHYLQGRKEFFSVWLGLKEGLPSLRVISMLISKLNPANLNLLIDMILIGNSFPSLRKLKIWENDRGIVLGELFSDISEDEPVPFADALETIVADQTCITLNLPVADPRSVQLVRRFGGDYIFNLNEIQGEFYNLICASFENNENLKKIQETASYASHNESKTIEVLNDLDQIPGIDLWNGIRSALRVRTEIQEGSRESEELRYYLISTSADQQKVRILATIENRTDWYIDVDFTKGGLDYAAENLESLRLYSVHLLSKFATGSQDLQSERRKAAKDNAHLRAILSH